MRLKSTPCRALRCWRLAVPCPCRLLALLGEGASAPKGASDGDAADPRRALYVLVHPCHGLTCAPTDSLTGKLAVGLAGGCGSPGKSVQVRSSGGCATSAALDRCSGGAPAAYPTQPCLPSSWKGYFRARGPVTFGRAMRGVQQSVCRSIGALTGSAPGLPLANPTGQDV